MQPRDPRVHMAEANGSTIENMHQDHSVPRTRARFHEVGVSTNNAVRPREDCKVGAVSECEDADEKPSHGEEEERKP